MNDIFILVLSLSGIYICRKGFKKNNIQKYGFLFFLLIALSQVWNFLNFMFFYDIVSTKISEAQELTWYITLLNIPPSIARIAAYFIICIGFYRYNTGKITDDA